MKILITGGAGLIGSHAAEYYAQCKANVIVLDNLSRSSIFNSKKKSVEHTWKYLQQFKNITRIKGDVRKEADILKALGLGVDVVIHAAGQPGISNSINNPREDFSINAYGTLNVLECLKKKKNKPLFIYCSSNNVYGKNISALPVKKLKTRYAYKSIKGVNEELAVDLSGHTPYSISKLAGEIYVQEYARFYGLKTVIFRMGCVYGPRQYGVMQQGWVSWFLLANLLREKITIFGDGKQVRDLLYVDDLVMAFDKFICSGADFKLYNIGGGPKNSVSLLEFLDLMERQTGKQTRVEFGQHRICDQKVYITDIAKVKRELNWHQDTNIASGIEKVYTWVNQNIKQF